MQAAWLAMYRNFDDDALAALASVGLLRRAAKDVEAGKVAIEGPVATAFALLRADAQAVRIGADGPARAQCDCPAPGICKHILAAALFLRSIPAAAGDEVPAADPLSEVIALDPAALFKLAGAAATRKAAALFAEAGPATIGVQGGVLIIELPALELVCRYIAGAGFQGMVSEAPGALRAALHLLALATVWRDKDRAFAWPDSVVAPRAAGQPGFSATEVQFLQSLQHLILELCRNGWSHVSEVMPAQLRASGLSARVESFPRLAAMLRTLAASTEALATRDAASDERQAIKLAARIDALCRALQQATGDALQELRGSARRSFDGNEVLELLPLGAHWWEQRNGARGLSIAFWDHSSGSILQTILARRAANDPGFTRHSAWSFSALWQGAGSVQTLLDGGLALEHARLSNDNRLSLSSETRARVLARWTTSDERWHVAGFDDWHALAASVRSGAGLRGDAADCFMLKPTSFDPPRLDEVRQLLCWTVRDRNGLPLELRLRCAPHHLDRISNIEAWAASGATIKAIMVRLDRDVQGGILEPTSLVIDDTGTLRPIALDYIAPKATMAPTFLGRIARMLKSKEVATAWHAGPSHLVHLEALLNLLENKAMTGRLHLLGDEKAELMAAQRYLRATGLDTIAGAVGRYVAAPDAAKALGLVHLCHTCSELDVGFIVG